MIRTFKEKAPQVQAVEFTGVSTQLTELADLIKADSFTMDVSAGLVSLKVGEDTHTVKQGQVLSVSGESVSVFDAEAFYARYEAL